MRVRWLWDRAVIEERETDFDLAEGSVIRLQLQNPAVLPGMKDSTRLEVELDTQKRCSLCKQPWPIER